MDKLMSIKDVAERLGLCEKTVYHLVRDVKLAHVRMGKKIRVTEEQVAAYVESCRVSISKSE